MEDEGATPDIEKIRGLVELMQRHDLGRLTLTEGGLTIRLESGGPVASTPVTTVMPAVMPAATPWPAAAGQPLAPPAAPAPEAAVPAAPEGVPLASPTTGTFFRAPAPGDPPFVEVGDRVEVGQTIGIIMAMKVMSEVPAETAGVVTAIPAEDGELVHAGSPLIVVKAD